MKKLSHILNISISSILLLVTLAFIVLEGRLVFSGDWLLHEVVALALMQYLFRLLLALFAFAAALVTIIRGGKRAAIYEGVCLLAASAVMAFFVTNSFGFYFILLSLLFIFANIFVFKAENKL